MTSSRPVSIPPLGGTGQLVTASLLSTASPSSETQVHTKLTAKFLGMIPRDKLSDASPETSSTPPEKVGPGKKTPQERVQQRREQQGDTPKLLNTIQTAARVEVRLRTETVGKLAEAIVKEAEESGRLLSARATAVYSLLVTATLAYHVKVRPEVTAMPNRLVAFLIVDELGLLLDLSRATIYRALNDLAKTALVDHRAWYTGSGVRKHARAQPSSDLAAGHEETRKLGTAAAGTLVDVVLTPKKGTRAKVTALDLKHRSYRNLDADRRIGRTAWQWMAEVKEFRGHVLRLEAQVKALRQSKGSAREIRKIEGKIEDLRQSVPYEEIEYKINHILRWTLNISDQKPVVLTVSDQQQAVYRLDDLRTATAQQRGELINERAEKLCLITGDRPHNLRFWCWLLWRVTELEYTQPGTIQTFSAAVTRLLTDLREWGADADTRRPLKSPAALFIARLKKSGWWDELKAMEAA